MTTEGISAFPCSSGDRCGGAILGNGALVLANDVTLAQNTAQLGGAIFQLSGNLSVKNSSFKSNSATIAGGAIFNDNYGWIMTISGSTFNSNSAPGGGAVLDYNSSVGHIDNDVFTGNAAPGPGSFDGGGAVLLDANSGDTLNHDEFDGNSADRRGAVRWDYAGLSSDGSSFVGNSASVDGGAIYADAGDPLTLTNATISKDTATTDGGGLYFNTQTPTDMINDTIAYNTAGTSGGGVYGTSFLGSNDVGVENTIIADNTGADCGDSGASPDVPSSADAGYNLDSDSTCFTGTGASGDKPGANPMLGQPANNGGPVLTDAELAGSPAIDSGTDSNCPATDARGVARPQGASCDIGAYEYNTGNGRLSLGKAAPSSAPAGSLFNYVVTAGDKGPGPSTTTTVVDQLPANTTLYAVNPSQGSCSSTGSPAKVTCSLGTIGSGSGASVTITVSVSQIGTVTNTASATNDQGSSATASATTTITSPAPGATTGPAINVTKTTATLTGSVATGGQPTGYFFQYGTTNAYGKTTPIGHTASSNTTVLTPISGLTQGTTYHFRLVAVNDSGTSYGADKTFRTGGTTFLGSLLLLSRTVTVKNGLLSAKFKCASSKECFGLFSVTARIKVKHNQFATIVCTKSRFARYSIGAHKTKVVSVPVHQVCVVYAQAHAGYLTGKLTTRPRTAQRGLVRKVKLVLQ